MRYVSRKDMILPKRSKSSHKGQNGKLLIIGGSKEYTGALALAGIAALRTGVDWVTIAAPEKVAWVLNTLSPDLVTKKLKGDYLSTKHLKELLTLAKQHNVVLIGNGLGIKSNILVKEFLKKVNLPCVIDADAIKAISLKEIDNCILTPHRKEFLTLLKNSNFIPINKRSMKKLQSNLKNNVLLIKGMTDEIVSKNKIKYNKTGNPGMTKSGTGDILAGLTAGFLAQGLTKEQSAINASYYNGILGDLQLKKHKGYTYLASDLLEDIKKVLK